MKLDQLIITTDMSIEQAMQRIDQGACKTVFLVQDGVLKGTLTDGDVRRFLLRGGSIKENVAQVVNYHPKFFYEDSIESSQEFMSKHVLTALPVVDEHMKLLRIDRLNDTSIHRDIPADVPVIMMAGGLGTRLKPYTEIIPKPLIPIGPKTIAEHILDRFEAYNCKRFYMILNYKKSLIEAYFKDIATYEGLGFVEEPFFMGTAGGIGLLKEQCKEDFFLVNCDIIVESDYYHIWKEHCERGNIVSMVSARKTISVPYGTVEADDGGRVTKLVEKPQLVYNVNTGMYLCNSKIFEYLDNNEKIDMPDLILRCIAAGERVGQVVIEENHWYDMGQPDELENMKKQFLSN